MQPRRWGEEPTEPTDVLIVSYSFFLEMILCPDDYSNKPANNFLLWASHLSVQGKILARHKVCLVKQFYFYMHNCYIYCFIINNGTKRLLHCTLCLMFGTTNMLQYSPTYVPLSEIWDFQIVPGQFVRSVSFTSQNAKFGRRLSDDWLLFAGLFITVIPSLIQREEAELFNEIKSVVIFISLRMNTVVLFCQENKCKCVLFFSEKIAQNGVTYWKIKR